MDRNRTAMARRPVVALLILALAAFAFPLAAVASHQFGDVPNSNTFHADIDAIADAGITSGCGGGNYCPSDNVTRGQMAGFMHRGFSRGASAGAQVTGLTDGLDHQITSVTVEAGEVPGGTGFLVVTASATLFTTTAGVCPCTLGVRPDIAGQAPTYWAFQGITDSATPFIGASYRMGTATNTWMFPVDTGPDYTIRLLVATDVTGGSVAVQGNLSAVFVPFGPTGGNTPASEAGPRSVNGLAETE